MRKGYLALIFALVAVGFVSADGVPSGTVVAWYPSKEDIIKSADGTKFKVPDGWSLCDGAVHGGFTTPNLTNQFILGTNDPTLAGKSVGTDAITLTGTSYPSQTVIHALSTQNGAVPGTFEDQYQDSVTVSGKVPKPPSVYLVYIIRNP